MHYKFLKKIIGALGYKLIDKNLVKNERLLSDFTYPKFNKILDKLFISNQINSVIQIGSNDGKRFDELSDYIESYNPKVIFVEPIKFYFDDLKKNYSNKKNFTFENLAISVDNEINVLFKVKNSKIHLYDEYVLGITSFDKNHLIKHGVNKNHIETVKVETISISDLLKKHAIDNFDLLSIDTEGYDCNIVIDFLTKSKIRPIIIFEYIHSKHLILKNALEILKKQKYNLVKINENILSFPEEKNKVNIF